MENRIQYIFLALCLATSHVAFGADSQDAEPPSPPKGEETAVEAVLTEPERTPVDIADIDALDVEIGVQYGMMNVEDFGTNAVIGGWLAYHISEDLFVQAEYGQSTTEPTSFERLSGAQLLTDDQRDLQYYDLTLGFNLLPGEGFVWDKWAFNSDFYVLAGVGSTNFADDNRFTVTWGGGYKVILADWLAIKLEFSDHFYDIDLLGEPKTSHNLSYQAGFSIFF